MAWDSTATVLEMGNDLKGIEIHVIQVYFAFKKKVLAAELLSLQKYSFTENNQLTINLFEFFFFLENKC